MPTPAAVPNRPTPENIHLYRAAALAWRNAWRVERVKDKLANPHVPLDAAAVAVRRACAGDDIRASQDFRATSRRMGKGRPYNAWIFDR